MVDWTTEKLVKTAQAFDRSAQRSRRYYSSYRRIAFTARKWARSKVGGGGD